MFADMAVTKPKEKASLALHSTRDIAVPYQAPEPEVSQIEDTRRLVSLGKIPRCCMLALQKRKRPTDTATPAPAKRQRTKARQATPAAQLIANVRAQMFVFATSTPAFVGCLSASSNSKNGPSYCRSMCVVVGSGTATAAPASASDRRIRGSCSSSLRRRTRQ